MGPIRGGLILSVLSASPVFADVCGMLRPEWSPADGASSAINEALIFLMSPLALLTIAFVLAAYFLRQAILVHAALALAVSLTAVLVIGRFIIGNPVLEAARSEGCVGPDYLRIAMVLLILAGAVYVMLQQLRPTKQGE